MPAVSQPVLEFARSPMTRPPIGGPVIPARAVELEEGHRSRPRAEAHVLKQANGPPGG
jgi:hypothetical protein